LASATLELLFRVMITAYLYQGHSKVILPIFGMPWTFLLLALQASLPFCSGIVFPSEISIRAGILHAPPFATVAENGDGTYAYGGLQVDLLKRLQIFAAQDNVKLNFDMSPSPISYGDAFDLIANDCNTTESFHSTADCNRFDLIVADYYANGDRSFRAELSPSWLRSTISTVKYTAKTEGSVDVTTMKQAVAFDAPVCLVYGTYYARVLQEKFPDANWLFCPSQDLCLETLQREECYLYADDELQLRFRAAHDVTLEVTPESFNTQFLVWASRFDMPGAPYLRKWIYDSVANATVDELYFKYFQKELCPVGTAGESCELPCDPNTGEADERGFCVCISTKWTGDDCSIEVPEETNLVSDSLLIMAWSMLSINCLTILGFSAWLYYQRQSPEVRLAQPFFLSLILFGCLISSSTIAAMTQGDDGSYEETPACMLIPWLYSVGFSITFGTLFAKIRRVYLLFKSAAEMRKNKVTFKETAMVTAAVLLLDIIILSVWTIVDPLKWERKVLRADKFGDPLESEGHCTSQHWEWWIGTISVLHLALLGVACYMCYVSRDISTKFSEGKYVSVAMFSNLQIFVVGVPILIILGSDPETSFFIRTVIIWMNDFVVVTLIFGSLIYRVHFSKEDEDGKTPVNVAIHSAISKFSRLQQGRRTSSNDDRSSKVRSGVTSSHAFSVAPSKSKYDSDLPELPEEMSEVLVYNHQKEPVDEKVPEADELNNLGNSNGSVASSVVRTNWAGLSVGTSVSGHDSRISPSSSCHRSELDLEG
jgi:hypothetical protein